MCETAESLAKYLRENYSRAVQFARIGRGARMVINNSVNDFTPTPMFERVAAPSGIGLKLASDPRFKPFAARCGLGTTGLATAEPYLVWPEDSV